MKKSLVALAALSAISAFADVDVSGGIKLYGVLDQALTSQSWLKSGTNQTSSHNTGLFAAGATSRLGARGARDLGDDIKGLIQIEIELAPHNNSDQSVGTDKNAGLLPVKNRGTFVGLEKKDIGSIKLGTQETTAYELFAMDVNGRVEYKPQVWRYVASSGTQDRAGQAIKLTSSEIAGFTASLMTAPQENTASGGGKVTGSFNSVGLKYHAGAFKANLVWDKYVDTTTGATAAAGKYRFPGDAYEGVVNTRGSEITYATGAVSRALTRNIAGASYDMGSAQFVWIYADSGNSIGKLTTNTVGVRVPMDKFALAASYGDGNYKGAASGKVSDITLGGYYNFDKSTSVYLLNSNAGHTATGSAAGYTKTTAIGAQFKF